MNVDKLVWLRGLATLFSLQGMTRQADALNKLATLAKSGAAVDAHMATVADAFEANTEASWEDLTARIDEEVAEFLARS